MKKMEMEALLDDNVIIPDDIKNMSKEQLEKAIQELEKKLGIRSKRTDDQLLTEKPL